MGDVLRRPSRHTTATTSASATTYRSTSAYMSTSTSS